MGNKRIVSKELESLEKDAALEKYKTALKKVQFINEIKAGLGKEIKDNPNGVIIHKKTFSQKIREFFKKIFTKF